MFSTTPTLRIPRRAAVAAALTITAACAAPAGALAADAPTLGAPTIIPAGQQSPIDVGGNHLHQHDVIRKGTALVRWPVAMHGKSDAPITLTCPTGTIHSGLGLQEGSDVAFGVVKNNAYYKRSIDVRFFVAPKADASTARGHVYALCRDTSIAPLAPAVGDLTVRKAGRKSPVDVAGNHLHQGHRIRKGTQLLRWSVSMRGRSTATTTLSCPRGMVHRGLAQQEGTKVSATVLRTSGYGHRTIKVRFSSRPGGSGEAAGSIYALCG